MLLKMLVIVVAVEVGFMLYDKYKAKKEAKKKEEEC